MTDDLGNTLYKRNKTYFPNVNTGAGNQMFPMAPGVAEGQARMAQIANTSTYKSRRSGGSMVNNPSGGSMFVPSGKLQGYLDQGYTINTPPRTPVQQFDINQAYNTGYGVPNPTVLQGAGGPYRVAGGVANPISFPNVFQKSGSDLSTGLGLMAKGAGAIGSFATNQFNNIFNRPNPTPTYVNRGPTRYFDL